MINKDGRTLYSSMITPDGTVLISHNRHDFVEHTEADGSYYMLDGGMDYTRYSGDGRERFITVTDSDDFETIREHFTRGSRGKDGTSRLKHVTLCKMTDDHLRATIAYCKLHQALLYIDIYEEELNYRNDNGICIFELDEILIG